MTAVGVVGLGRMGGRIAGRLRAARYDVVVWNRTPERAGALVAAGARTAATPAALAGEVDVLLTVVADPPALRAVTEGADGIFVGARDGLAIIEMSTVGPAAVARLRERLPAGRGVLDAPVHGSVERAEAGELAIFVGGDEELFAQWRPLLEALGRPTHVGRLGAGAAAKLVVNAALFMSVAAVGEALALARVLGLGDDIAFQVLRASPLSAEAERRRPAIERRDYRPRFALALAAKDADLVVDATTSAAVGLPLVRATRQWLATATAAGWGDCDYTAILASILDRAAGNATSTGASAKDATFDGLIIDLDGVVWVGDEAVAGVVAALAELRKRVPLIFLTNDPTGSRSDYAARLNAIGVSADEDEILTSGRAIATFISEREGSGRSVFAIGSPAFKAELEDVGLTLVDGDAGRTADTVAIGGHPGFDYAELRTATQAVRRGAQLYAAGRDATFPMPDGPWPATGAIVAAVETAGGVRATCVGKPEPYIFELARTFLPDCEAVAIVGDNLASDIAGGKRAGHKTILVLGGSSSEEEIFVTGIHPDHVVTSLAELVELAAPTATAANAPGLRR